MTGVPESLRLVLASANPDKAVEIETILRDELGSLIEINERPSWIGDVEETGSTLEENARIKSFTLFTLMRKPAVADDTGLEVAALNGAPGIYAARYAGENASYADNVTKLLHELFGERDRAAIFRTVALVSFGNGHELIASGLAKGRIAEEPKGEAGFGYDAVFIPDDGDGRTFAEMSRGEKDAISHRGRAFRALARLISSSMQIQRSTHSDP